MILYEWQHTKRWQYATKTERDCWEVVKNMNGDRYLIATFATEEDAKVMMNALGRAIECQLE